MDELMRQARAVVYDSLQDVLLEDALERAAEDLAGLGEYLMEDEYGDEYPDWDKIDSRRAEIEAMAQKLIDGMLKEMSGWQR